MKFSLATLYHWYRKLVRNPQTRWWVVLGTIVYLFSPVDFAPDIFPFAGQIDDFLLITLLLSELFQIAITGADEQWQAEPPSGSAPPPPASGNAAEPQDTIDVKSVTIED
ncbi:MAG: YkvA family protein [Prochlorotrichaceae cyanobacterium]|jgi:uncharacterized membrane protein YkvA (DUF1232 family)